MAEHYFLNPFALSGDKATIPEATQPDGTVSYEEGFGQDYQLEQGVDPDAKDIPRDKFNQLAFQITEAIRQIQGYSAPSYITSAANGGSPFSYARGVIVMWTDNKLYQSQVAANTTDPSNTTNWKEVTGTFSVPDASTTVKGIIEIATPAEAIAGTDTDRAVTSQGLAAFKNLATNGYMIFPGGLIIQWGFINVPAQATITFPVAFTTACYSVTGSCANEAASANRDVGFDTPSTTQVRAVIDNGTTHDIRWIAIGK
jgi:hypothetical protein